MREIDTRVEVAASHQSRSTIAFVFMILRAMVWGFFIGVLINSYLWMKEGYAQFARNAQQTYQQQMENIALRNTQVAKASARGDVWLETNWQHSLQKTQQLSWQVPWLIKLDQYVDVSHYLENSQVFWHRLVSMLVLTAKVVIAKCISLFASVWVFVFAALMGALDGLVARYIRTSEGGRESTFVFHKVADGLLKIPVILLFLYLTSPFFVNPEWVVVLMGVMFFAFFYTATANLKKFL